MILIPSSWSLIKQSLGFSSSRILISIKEVNVSLLLPQSLNPKLAEIQKPLKTLGFQGFISCFSIQFEKILVAHLSCNFCCEVFVFLFDTFTSFETNESLNSNICTVFFCNFFYVFSNC